MSEKFKELQKRIVEEIGSVSEYPNFVVRNQLNQKTYQIGDCKLEYDDEWSHSTTYFRFRLGKQVNWDYKKSNELYSIVKKYPRFGVLQPKQNPDVVEIVTRRTPITQKMLYDHFLIFDKYNYEDRNVEDMLSHLKNDHENYMAQWDGVPKTKAEAEGWFADRIVAAINENTVRFWDLMLLDGADLLGDIVNKVFDAKTH